MASEALDRLLRLFECTGKREVERYCRDLTITSEAFAGLVLAGNAGLVLPYLYENHFVEIRPPSLEPTPDQLQALASTKTGQRATGAALTALRKFDQTFRDRRMLAVHLFYTRGGRFWHMFYFDQRDYQAAGNHWKQGPHMHYSQDSFTRESLAAVMTSAKSAKPELPPCIHVRYDYHHNRNHLRGK